jgi:phosphoribosylglycinamide formyltransferase-1
MKNIIILASGSGSNAENIVKFFDDTSNAKVSYILSNNVNAPVLLRAKKLNIKTKVFNKTDFNESGKVLKFLKNEQPDLIVLAGFLWLVPTDIVKTFPQRIINIHPALLPKHGGKGMYGAKVHQTVVENKESESGITIHYVNEKYDSGDIIFQASCKVLPSDDAEAVAQKVHALEYQHFPKIILALLQQQ